MTRALLLYNPRAGRFPVSPRRIKEISAQLLRLGVDCTLSPTPPPPYPEGWPVLQGYDLVITYGGDGTVHAAAGSAASTGVPLAILPGGTANVLARELGIPSDPRRAVPIIARGKKKKIHLGQTGSKHFLLMAGIGFDGYLLSRVTPTMKQNLGILAYWLAGPSALIHCPLHPFQVEVEDTSYQATFAVLGNASSYGGQLKITPAASLEETQLDLCLFTSTNKLRYLAYLWGIITATHTRYPDVIYRKVERIRVSADPLIQIQLDGELYGERLLEFRSSSDTLDVVVP